MNTFQQMNDLVFQVLTEMPSTRNSDRTLIVEVLRRKGVNVNAPFSVLMKSDLPTSFETITRCRRKCMELYPELHPVQEVQEERWRLEEVFRTGSREIY